MKENPYESPKDAVHESNAAARRLVKPWLLVLILSPMAFAIWLLACEAVRRAMISLDWPRHVIPPEITALSVALIAAIPAVGFMVLVLRSRQPL